MGRKLDNFFRGMFKLLVFTLLVDISVGSAPSPPPLAPGYTLTKYSYKSVLSDGAATTSFYKIDAPLLPVPNTFIGGLQSGDAGYYMIRYFTSLYSILADCFFFEGTSCV